MIKPGVTEAIRKRFAWSHEVATVVAGLETVPIPPVDLSFLTADETRSALREVRGPQTWLLLTPNVGPPQYNHHSCGMAPRAWIDRGGDLRW